MLAVAPARFGPIGDHIANALFREACAAQSGGVSQPDLW